jgi:LPS-assembly lipoprotein
MSSSDRTVAGAPTTRPSGHPAERTRPVPATGPEYARSRARRALLAGAAAGLASLAAGCGFRLRGSATVPFQTLFIANDNQTPFYLELRRTLSGLSGVRLAPAPGEAEAVLELTPPNPIDDKAILSLSGGGRVREFSLTKRVIFRVHDGKGGEWLPTGEIVVRRDYTYDDSLALAKENEERMLLADMQSDIIQQIVRRLQLAQRPPG